MSKIPKKVKKDRARKAKIKDQKHRDKLKNQGKNSKKLKAVKKVPLTQEMFSDKQFRFWLAHGVNYIVSDYEEGLWDPLFPSIYEGKEIGAETMAQVITDKFAPLADKDKHCPKEGRTAMSWSLIPREVVYVYYRESLRSQAERMKDLKFTGTSSTDLTLEQMVLQPSNANVWEVFKHLIDQVRDKV